jgi:hypothetical protein
LGEIRNGSIYRRHFLEKYADSKYNLCFSISGDGVQKSAITDKTVFPVAVRVESTPVSVKHDENLQHVCVLAPGDYQNLNHYLAKLSGELKCLESHGIKVNIAGVGVKVVKACVILLGGDLRAIQSMAGKYRDPAIKNACPGCELEGERHGANRTIYKESKHAANAYAAGDSLGPKFKRVPVLGYGISNLEEKLAMCFAHNVKNGMQRIFGMHGDVGKGVRLTDELRSLEPHRCLTHAHVIAKLLFIYTSDARHHACDCSIVFF